MGSVSPLVGHSLAMTLHGHSVAPPRGCTTRGAAFYRWAAKNFAPNFSPTPAQRCDVGDGARDTGMILMIGGTTSTVLRFELCPTALAHSVRNVLSVSLPQRRVAALRESGLTDTQTCRQRMCGTSILISTPHDLCELYDETMDKRIAFGSAQNLTGRTRIPSRIAGKTLRCTCARRAILRWHEA